MKSNICAFIGSGDLAFRCAGQLQDLGLALVGASRNPDALPSAFKGIKADYTRTGNLGFLSAVEPDFVIATFKPSKYDLVGYEEGFVAGAKNLVDGLGLHTPKLVIFVSSTRIFAEDEGGWINEQSPRTKTDPFGKLIIQAEKILSHAGLPLVTLYCSGLYGSSDDYLVKKIRQGSLSSRSKKYFTNRIHREDVSGVLAWLIGLKLRQEKLAKSYIVSDGNPAARSEVEYWLAERLNISHSECQVAKSAVTRAGNKRCDNRKLLKSGYKFLFPDYKSGYESLIESQLI